MMAKKKNLEKLEELAKKAVEDEESWVVVRGGSKVILINEDELKVKPIDKVKKK
jgi:hypothetical protein